MNDLLFRNGTVFDGHRFLPAGTVVRVRGAGSPELARLNPSRRWGPPSRSTWTAGRCFPASSTRTLTRSSPVTSSATAT
jgi:hypothetical protein